VVCHRLIKWCLHYQASPAIILIPKDQMQIRVLINNWTIQMSCRMEVRTKDNSTVATRVRWETATRKTKFHLAITLNNFFHRTWISVINQHRRVILWCQLIMRKRTISLPTHNSKTKSNFSNNLLWQEPVEMIANPTLVALISTTTALACSSKLITKLELIKWCCTQPLVRKWME
jgi:hypothetical protein